MPLPPGIDLEDTESPRDIWERRLRVGACILGTAVVLVMGYKIIKSYSTPEQPTITTRGETR